jgi:hypothetical protein
MKMRTQELTNKIKTISESKEGIEITDIFGVKHFIKGVFKAKSKEDTEETKEVLKINAINNLQCEL